MKKIVVVSSIFALLIALALPVLTEEKTDDGSAQAIKTELKAMAKRTEQTKCPISGKPITEGQGVVFHGYMIGTCCGDCAKVVEKDPLAALLAMRKNGEEPKLAKGYTLETTCPVSGKPLNAETATVKNNVMVTFCCPNCKAAFENDPASILGKMDEKKIAAKLITIEQTTCPISGEPITGGSSLQYKGKEVKFCCDDCKAAFEAAPDKYLQALADKGVVLASAK